MAPTSEYEPNQTQAATVESKKSSKTKLIVGAVGASLLAAVGGGIAATQINNAESAPILTESPDPNDEEIEVNQSELEAENGNSLTNEQLLEVAAKCPEATLQYDDALIVLSSMSEDDAQSVYMMCDKPSGDGFFIDMIAMYKSGTLG